MGLAERHLARILVDEGLEARRALEKWGVVLSPTQYPPVRPEGIARSIDPMPGLANVIRGNTDITVLERVMVTDLLTRDGVCVGAVAINEEDGEVFLLKSGSIILATGGDAQLFKVNLHPSCVTGDGYAMGYDVGAELMNMEFMQIYSATAYPTFNNLNSAAWKVHPKIVNANGEEFIQNYLPEGVTTEECVAHHCSNGGLIVDENGQTAIPALYAVGETAAGPHGADRLGGGMQAFCQVFGMRAGKHAAAVAKTRDLSPVDEKLAKSQLERIAELRGSKGDQKPVELMKRLKQTAWDNLLAVRTKEGLTELLKEIGRIRSELVPRLSIERTPELVQTLELTNLLQVGEIVANAALVRTESRGGHYRDDFPERDDNHWLHAITVKKAAGKMQLGTLKLDDEWEDKPALLEGWWG